MNTIENLLFNEHLKSFSEISNKKKKKNLVVFIGHDSFSENSKYLFLSMVRNGSVECIWCTENKSIVDELTAANLPVHHLGLNDTATINLLLEARIAIFSITPYVAIKKNIYYYACLAGAIKIQLWHGISVKKLMLQLTPYISLRNVNHALATSWACNVDYFLSPSTLLDDYWKEAFGCDNIIHAGYPRNEVIVRDAYPSEMIGAKFSPAVDLAIKSNRKKIIIMPTWQRDKVSPVLTSEFLTNVMRFAIKNSVDVYLKVHKHYYDFGSNQADFSLLKVKGFYYIDNDIDIYPHLNKFDLLLTDYSSVMFDFLLTGKPIVAYDFSEKSHQNYEPDYSLLPVNDDFIYKIADDNVEQILNKAIRADGKKGLRMKAIESLFHGEAHLACENIFHKIKNILINT